MENLKVSFTDKLCTPNIFSEFSFVSMDFGDVKVKFLANDLDAYLFSRGRLTDMQLAALSSQLSIHSSAFDNLTDEQRIKFLNSRYNQNFASVDAFRRYLVDNMSSLESSLEDESENSVDSVDSVNPDVVDSSSNSVVSPES